MRLNKLTQQLLSEGYTAENHPDYVRVGGGNFGRGDPLDNFYGGFEYTREYRNKMVFVTGCGRFVKGSELSNGSMFYMGIDWTVENDCPVITCPLRPDSCDKRFSRILGGSSGGGLTKIFQCDLRRTDKEWNYEESVQKLKDEESSRISEERKAFIAQKQGHACSWHMHYNYHERKWIQVYEPMVCARMCMNIGKTCDLTHKEISRKRGNVFYDLKVTRIHEAEDLFHGQEEITITKGIRYLKSPTSITICHEIAKRCMKDIVDQHRYSGEKVEVMNIRVEQRESRDLMQDLADLSMGIKIQYESDQKKEAKELKKARRQAVHEKKIQKLEKKLLEVGYENLNPYSLDRIHADKWLEPKRLAEIARQRECELEKTKPEQMSLFDMEGFEA